MMKLKSAAIFFMAAIILPWVSSARPSGTVSRPDDRVFREALELYEKGIYDRAMVLFGDIARDSGDEDAMGYEVLSAVNLRVPGYEKMISDFIRAHQSSGLIPQIRYIYALNLFDDKDFRGASAQFEKLSRHDIFRRQVPGFLFKRAYCDFQLKNIDRAVLRFKDLVLRAHSDYTAPAQYALGYIFYEQRNFSEAVEWFGKASKDSRFTDIAGFYLLESLFMLKEYEKVVKDGPAIMERVSEDKRPHVARLVSESYLVLGDAGNARKYFDESRKSLSPKSRSDFFYAGSVLYAVKDYQGAIDNFSMMVDRTDSLGQIANYHLGYCYIRTKNKVAAMSAFRDASLESYDKLIKEDAYFNYAKLAFDLNNDSSVFHDYLQVFSGNGKGEQIYSYIALAALYNRDYEGAIEAYDEIDELDPDMKDNYMKANYLRAHELVGRGSYRNAVPCLKAAAYYSDRRTIFNQLSRYWLAEAYYRSGEYQESRSVYMDLFNTSALFGMEESALIPYNIAYCYFKEENFQYAANWFSDYLDGKSVLYRKEAFVRYGDCMFMMQRYKDATEAYDRVLKDYFNVNDIYPYYQAALSYGLAGNDRKKVELLANVEEALPSSQFYPEAMYELGRSYVAVGEDEKAIDCFNRLAATVKDSTFMARSYIELGMVYRNRRDNDRALGYYKKVVEDMPMTEYADAALIAIESIYKSMNEPEKYIAYIDGIGRSSLKTEDEKETMIFNAAEQIYLSENYQKALASLKSYMEKYPSGRMVPNAEFYIAESYKNLGQPEAACDHYVRVLNSGSGSLVEIATLNYAVLSFSLQKYEDAYSAYASLYENASLENNRFTALAGMMRSAYNARMYDEAIRNAVLLKSDSRADENLMREADYISAKSYLATSRRDEAFAILARLASDPSTPEGAEAAYMVIVDSYDRGDFENVENKVYNFSDSGTGQTYWLAKAFIILGDSFVERGDLEQAKATFESVAQGYKPGNGKDDVLSSVSMRLEKLKPMMSGAVEQ